MVIHLTAPKRRVNHHQHLPVEENTTKSPPAELESERLQGRLNFLLPLAVIGAEDKRLGVADDYVHPLKVFRC